MNHLQQITKDWMKSNFDLYDDLIELLSKYLPSKYAKDTINMIEKIFGDYIHYLWDEDDSCATTYAVVPVEFIELDWKTLFTDMIELRSKFCDFTYDIDCCCECQTIPEEIRISRKCNCYDIEDDFSRMYYTCPRCNFENSVVIIDYIIPETVIVFLIMFVHEGEELALTII